MILMTVAAEQCLPAAIDRLYTAVARVVDESKELVGGVLHAAPSLYEQLVDAVPASPQHQGRRTVAGPVPPIFTDALDLKRGIDATAKRWHPGEVDTVARLRALAATRWAPPQTQAVDDMAAQIEAWAIKIGALLNPQSVKRLSAPCPSCGATTVHRRDSAGERVRQPALQIVAEQGCTCMACNATWAPTHYLHLCRVLGFELPAGVLE